MNEQDLQELRQLRLEQRMLRDDLSKLEERLAKLQASVENSPEAARPERPAVDLSSALQAARMEEAPASSPTPPPIPPPAPAPVPLTAPPPRPARPVNPWPSRPLAEASARTEPTAPARPKESLEIQLGAVWLARIGIVMLLTGFVFLGNYAWHTFGSHLGPAGRLTLLCLASATMAGGGAWLHRRRPETRLYAQVLLGGGAALAYYCAYAAHYVARLRVIESPLLAGVLLLGCGGGLLAVAERRRWRLAALLTILLSYYTAGINPIGEFTLYSNLLLTVAGIILLVRQRWTSITWVTLFGTYGSYTFWVVYRAYSAGSGLGDPVDPWLTGLVFLTCYWSFFHATVFLARAEYFPARSRVALLTLNNAAFLLLVVDNLQQHWPAALWAVCTGAGAVLLALGVAAWRWRREEPALDGAYLLQGVALATAGLAQKLTGPQLAVTLAVECLVLLTGVAGRHGWLWFAMAAAAGGWAFGEGLSEFRHPSLILPLGSTLSLLLVAAAWWLKQRLGKADSLRFSGRAAWFVFLSLLMAGVVMNQKAAPWWEPILFSLAAEVCTASLYALRLPEVVLGGQLFLLWAIGLTFRPQAPGEPWWFIWPVAACALAHAHWWQRQRLLSFAERDGRLLQALSAGALVVFGFQWMQQHLTGDPWLAALSAAALGTLLYGWLTRTWAIAACGQIFLIASVLFFLPSLADDSARWPAGLTTAAVVLLSWLLLPHVFGARRVAPHLASSYWWAGLALLAAWAFRHVDEEWQALFFAGGFLVLLGAAAWRKHELSLQGGALYALLTFAAVWLQLRHAPDLRSLAALLIVPAAARGALRFARAPSSEVQLGLSLLSALAAASLWIWVTRWCQWHGYGHSLTVAWSGTALVVLGAGLALRERAYRIAGFLILAFTLGRIFLVDVWQLDTLFRILSFLTLGGVLMLLGFLYSRYSEQIRRWL